jgi:glutathione synthase/RimK-type ligase-like ATP-grasp enzyme
VPLGDEDAPPLIEALAERDLAAEPAIWDDAGVDWTAYDLVVLRSTWDYPRRRDAFLAWVDSLPRVLNPSEVVRWNTDKRYLEALGREGVPTVPTRFLAPEDAFEPPSEPFVVKPAVGAGSIGAARYEPGDEQAREHMRALLAEGQTVMIQPYLTAVDDVGETTLLYVGDAFSHAVHKGPLLMPGRPPEEGLYVEETLTPVQPSASELAAGERALDAVPFGRVGLLYARVDLIPAADGSPVVLEVELTEPSLFLGYADGAVERFAAAIAAASQRRRMSAENGPIASQ